MTLQDAVRADEIMADKEFEFQKKEQELELARDKAEKHAEINDWLARWGLPVAGIIGVVIGGTLGVVATKK